LNYNFIRIESCGNSNIICYFGNSYSDDEWINRGKNKYKIEYYDKSLALTDYKFMSLKISESNEIMNDYIDEFSEIIKNKFEIDSWGQFSVESPAENYYIGRVRYHWNKNKLDDKSVMFEGSSYITNNETITLDLSRLSQYSLFAGQVMACKATNESGKTLIVRDIIDIEKTISLPKQMPTIKEALNLVVAVGPFTKPETLNWEPLKSLTKYAKQYEPDFLIIIGPLIDSMNEKLLSSDDSIERLFNSQMRFLNEELTNIKTEAIIISSVKDLNTFSVLPTMPFNAFKSPKIHFYPNPTVLDISGVIIGMTSTDVLLHLSKEEISA
jgi:DNA polymerase alpha subunit B